MGIGPSVAERGEYRSAEPLGAGAASLGGSARPPQQPAGRESEFTAHDPGHDLGLIESTLTSASRCSRRPTDTAKLIDDIARHHPRRPPGQHHKPGPRVVVLGIGDELRRMLVVGGESTQGAQTSGHRQHWTLRESGQTVRARGNRRLPAAGAWNRKENVDEPHRCRVGSPIQGPEGQTGPSASTSEARHHREWNACAA